MITFYSRQSEHYHTNSLVYLLIYLMIYLKVAKLQKSVYIYIHKSGQTNWLIKVNYPILQNKSDNLFIKTKEKEKNKSRTGL